MNIADIDENLRINPTLDLPDVQWLDASEAPFRVYGAADPKVSFDRVPPDVAAVSAKYWGLGEGIRSLAQNTAGVRLRFATDSPYIAISAKWRNQTQMPHMAFTGISGFDLYSCKEGVQNFVNSFCPPVNAPHGYDSKVDTLNGGVLTDYVLNFPLYNDVVTLAVGIQKGATLTAGTETYRLNELPVLFYGSSITQGGCASRPGTCYQGFVSRALNLNYINFGFSGSAKGEPPMTEYMASLPMSAFVCDYDHNAPDADFLNKTHYEVYRTVREKNPAVPIVLISRPNRGSAEEVKKRRIVVADTYRRAVEAGDKQVCFIDGGSFFKGMAGDSCNVDGCHPTDLGFYFMAEGITPVLKEVLFK